MSVQGAFEHLTFVCPQQRHLLHSQPRISLSDWKCLDSQFNFSRSSLALATCTFKICTFSSISCRWKSKWLFSARLPVVAAGRAASGVKDKCFGCSDSLSASELGIPRSVRLILLGSGESFSIACRNIFYNPVLLLLWHSSAFLQKKNHLNRPINWSYHRLRRDNVHECLKRVSALVASSCVLSPA